MLASQPSASDTTKETGIVALAESRGHILYIDELSLTRDCISRELQRFLPELKIVKHASAREVDSDDLSSDKWRVVVVYVHANRAGATQEGVDGEKLTAELALLEQLIPEVPRVLLSDFEVPEDIVRAFRRRIRGYVPTTLPIRQAAEAIRFVLVGGTFVPPSILGLSGPEDVSIGDCAEANPSTILANFSPKQNAVLRRLWRGSSNKVIAHELSMCESTVKVHIRHIMKKLRVSNRTQVVLRTRPVLLDDAPSTSIRSCNVRPWPAAVADTPSSDLSRNRAQPAVMSDGMESRTQRNGARQNLP
jgi:DNA-binding NarL/FixJ family response regulator